MFTLASVFPPRIRRGLRATLAAIVTASATATIAGCGGDIAFSPGDNGSAFMHATTGTTTFVGRFGVYATVAQGILTITGSDDAGNNISLVLVDELVEKTEVNGKQEFIVHSGNTQTLGFARYARKLNQEIYFYSTGSVGRGLSSGSIIITRYTDTNVQGTFSFTGCLPDGFEEGGQPSCANVQHGEFSVGVVR